MTTAANDRVARFDGNDVATEFDFDFKVFVNADVRLVFTDPLGVESDLVLDSDFSVLLNADQNADPGGVITYPLSGDPLATGEQLTATSVVEASQGASIPNAGGFYSQVVEKALDRAMIVIQQLAERIGRGLTLPISVSGVSTELPTPLAGRVIGWNAAADGLENLASAGEVSISAFMETVLDEPTAAAARAALGAGDLSESVFAAAGQILIGQANGDAVPVSTPLGGAQIINGKIALSVAASALTVALKGLDGNDPSATNPVFIRIPQNTAGVFDGTYAIRKVTAALSMVVSSGSTLGHTSAVACPVYFYIIDNAGTPELAVSSKFFGTPAVVSTVAEGGAGAADTATTMYSTTLRSNVSASLIGRWKSTQATAGTWAAVTGERQLYPFPYKKPTQQIFTASGTYTRPWDVLSIKVLSVAGGGGGGGGGVAASGGGASGGGAGGAAITFLDAAAISASETVTVGAAGSGGSGNTSGTGGGNTGFSGSNLCNASGGSGGSPGINNSTAQGVSGGNGTNGDILLGGGDSVSGAHVTSAIATGGKGGDSIFSGGGLGGHLGNNGNAGHSYGAGGGGSSVAGGAAGTGGNGKAGIVIVEEFYQ